MGARAWTLSLFPSSHARAERPLLFTSSALALAGYGGVPYVRASVGERAIEIAFESNSPLRAAAVNDDAWWLVRPVEGRWPAGGTLSLDLAPGHLPLDAPFSPWPASIVRPASEPTRVSVRVADGAMTKRPAMTFAPLQAEARPVMTWPGNPPRMAADVSLAGLVVGAGPLANVTLHARAHDGSRTRHEGWVEVGEEGASPSASWFTDEPPPRIVGLRVVDLAGNEATFGDVGDA